MIASRGSFGRVLSPVALFVSTAVLATHSASAKESSAVAREMNDIEARAKVLTQGKDAAARVTSFTKWLGLAGSCAVGVDTVVSAKWITANLDGDAEDERVLAITTSGGGKSPSTHLQTIIFDSTAKGWIAAAHTTFSLPAKSGATTEVVAASVHSTKVKDLVLRIDGAGDHAQELRVATFEHGKWEEIASSADFVGTALVSHTLSGGPPSVLQLVHDKGKAELWFDESAFAYDTLPGYDEARKKSTSADDAETLSTKECSAPLAASVALECGLEGNAKVQVLVQNGKATGLTVTSSPASASFVRCMRKHIAAASWTSTGGATGCTRTFATK